MRSLSENAAMSSGVALREAVCKREDRVLARLRDLSERCFELGLAVHGIEIDIEREIAGRRRGGRELLRLTRMLGIRKHRDARHPGHRLPHELQTFAHEIEREKTHAGRIAAGAREALGDAGLDGVAADAEHDRDFDTGNDERIQGLATLRDDDARGGLDDGRHLLREARFAAVPPPGVDHQVTALLVAQRAHAGSERLLVRRGVRAALDGHPRDRSDVDDCAQAPLTRARAIADSARQNERRFMGSHPCGRRGCADSGDATRSSGAGQPTQTRGQEERSKRVGEDSRRLETPSGTD